jgi:2Fe-2S ferredoxin
MAKVIYEFRDGTRQIVELDAGLSVMEGAILNSVKGIEGICGGTCSCGTCHVLVAEPWSSQLPPPQASEAAMLDTLEGRAANSRLGCQIVSHATISGIVVTVVNS